MTISRRSTSFPARQIRICAILFVSSHLHANAADIYPSSSTLDLGYIYQANTPQITRHIDLINDTGEDAQIKLMKASCGCTNLRVSSKVIPAHDRVQLYITVEPKNPGERFDIQIAIEFSKPDDLVIPLTVEGIFGDEIKCMPPKIVFNSNEDSQHIELKTFVDVSSANVTKIVPVNIPHEVELRLVSREEISRGTSKISKFNWLIDLKEFPAERKEAVMEFDVAFENNLLDRKMSVPIVFSGISSVTVAPVNLKLKRNGTGSFIVSTDKRFEEDPQLFSELGADAIESVRKVSNKNWLVRVAANGSDAGRYRFVCKFDDSNTAEAIIEIDH